MSSSLLGRLSAGPICIKNKWSPQCCISVSDYTLFPQQIKCLKIQFHSYYAPLNSFIEPHWVVAFLMLLFWVLPDKEIYATHFLLCYFLVWTETPQLPHSFRKLIVFVVLKDHWHVNSPSFFPCFVFVVVLDYHIFAFQNVKVDVKHMREDLLIMLLKSLKSCVWKSNHSLCSAICLCTYFLCLLHMFVNIWFQTYILRTFSNNF